MHLHFSFFYLELPESFMTRTTSHTVTPCHVAAEPLNFLAFQYYSLPCHVSTYLAYYFSMHCTEMESSKAKQAIIIN